METNEPARGETGAHTPTFLQGKLICVGYGPFDDSGACEDRAVVLLDRKTVESIKTVPMYQEVALIPANAHAGLVAENARLRAALEDALHPLAMSSRLLANTDAGDKAMASYRIARSALASAGGGK